MTSEPPAGFLDELADDLHGNAAGSSLGAHWDCDDLNMVVYSGPRFYAKVKIVFDNAMKGIVCSNPYIAGWSRLQSEALASTTHAPEPLWHFVAKLSKALYGDEARIFIADALRGARDAVYNGNMAELSVRSAL